MTNGKVAGNVRGGEDLSCNDYICNICTFFFAINTLSGLARRENLHRLYQKLIQLFPSPDNMLIAKNKKEGMTSLPGGNI